MDKIIIVLLSTLTLSACTTAAEQQAQNLAYDRQLCSSYGAEYGSPAHYQCMLIQQQRRDVQQAQANANMQRLANQINSMNL